MAGTMGTREVRTENEKKKNVWRGILSNDKNFQGLEVDLPLFSFLSPFSGLFQTHHQTRQRSRTTLNFRDNNPSLTPKPSSRICLRPSLSCKRPLRDTPSTGVSRSPSVHRDIQFNQTDLDEVLPRLSLSCAPPRTGVRTRKS